jgi:hypothetical protein
MMSEPVNHPAWMDDPLVQNIPQEKLDFLSKMFGEVNSRVQSAGSGKSQKEMLLLLMPVLKQARAANLSLTPQEIQAAIAAIRKHSTPEELEQIDKML